MEKTALHLAPHPDDELVGAPATLMALRDAGYRVVNLVCTLGRPRQRSRREAEAREACRRARFELRVADVDETRLRAGSGLHEDLVRVTREAIADVQPEIVVSPNPHDLHPWHELVARATRDALVTRRERAPRWWMWAVWSHLPLPTVATGFGESRLEEVLEALAAHAGELTRNDYRKLVRGRAVMQAAVGPELLFGFGAHGTDAEYVELVTEAVLSGGNWMLGRARWLDPPSPLADPTEIAIDDWLHGKTVTQRFGPPGYRAARAGNSPG